MWLEIVQGQERRVGVGQKWSMFLISSVPSHLLVSR